MKDETWIIESEEEVHDNFTQVPNIVMHMGLSPYAFRLYVQVRMTVGYGEREGMCYKGVRRLAKECNMSMTSVIKARKELEDLGLIVTGLHKEGNLVTYLIKIKSIWRINSLYFKIQRSKYGTD
jgi:hypothetical protein